MDSNQIEDHVKEMRVVKDKLGKLIDKWIDIYGFYRWEIGVDYHFEKNEENPATKAKAHVRWEYMHGTISIYLPTLTKDTDDELESLIIHELGHFLVNEMREFDSARPDSINHEERVVSHLSAILVYLTKQQKTSTEPSQADTPQCSVA